MGVFDFTQPTSDEPSLSDVDDDDPDPDRMTRLTDSTPGRDYNTLRGAVPRAVEEEAGLKPGDALHFRKVEDGRMIVEVIPE